MSTLIEKKKLTNSQKLAKQKGFTMIEFLLVLGLGAILTGVVLSNMNNGKTTTEAEALSKSIVSMGASLVKSSAATGTYGSGTSLVEYLIRTKKVPSSLSVTGTSPNRILNHKFGGTVELTGRVNKLVVTVNDLPGNVCMDLFTSAAAWERVLVSDTAPASISVTSGGYTPPYTQVDAASACSEANLNRMHFIN